MSDKTLRDEMAMAVVGDIWMRYQVALMDRVPGERGMKVAMEAYFIADCLLAAREVVRDTSKG